MGAKEKTPRNFYTHRKLDRLNAIFYCTENDKIDQLPQILANVNQIHRQEISKEQKSINRIISIIKPIPHIKKINTFKNWSSQDIHLKRDVEFNYTDKDKNININIGIQVKSSEFGVKKFLNSFGSNQKEIDYYLAKRSLIVLSGNSQILEKKIYNRFIDQ